MIKLCALFVCGAVLGTAPVLAQENPYTFHTLLPSELIAEIVGESSGETAWNTIMETGGYNKDRQAEEYGQGTFYEAAFVHAELVRYGLPGAELVRMPGREVWDGIKGELWEVAPRRQKLASYRDMTAMLARGSSDADVRAQLVWVGRGTPRELEGLELEGKVVVCEGSPSSVHNRACLEGGAAGVIAISDSGAHYDPQQIPWRGIGSWRGGGETRFAFYMTAREGALLRRRLQRGERITVHAQVEATERPYELQNVTCHIPGTDPDAGEVIFSAHLFEGYVKQGANDNKSGSAAILEVARVLNTLIAEGRMPRPKRTIRFLWGPEFSGTGPWVKANRELMERTLCNINMDMVGEWLSISHSFACLMRTTYGHAHYVNDVLENYFRYVGWANRTRIHGGRGVARQILAPTGSDEPFYFSIERHYGASDHEVFNDWGVGVPGVMMICWPDRWYHTSGDRVDKSDPTQLKRAVVIGAAGAYTIASADDALAIRIATEAAANATRRLGLKLEEAAHELEHATPETLADAQRSAPLRLRCALAAEEATLDSVLELASDRERVAAHVDQLKESLRTVVQGQMGVLEAQLGATCARLGVEPARLEETDLERQAAQIVPRPTAKVTEGGYGAWRALLEELPEEELAQLPYRRGVADTRELPRLIDGKRSALQIRDMLDAQSRRPSDLQGVLNYLRVLEMAGLVDL